MSVDAADFNSRDISSTRVAAHQNADNSQAYVYGHLWRRKFFRHRRHLTSACMSLSAFSWTLKNSPVTDIISKIDLLNLKDSFWKTECSFPCSRRLLYAIWVWPLARNWVQSLGRMHLERASAVHASLRNVSIRYEWCDHDLNAN